MLLIQNFCEKKIKRDKNMFENRKCQCRIKWPSKVYLLIYINKIFYILFSTWLKCKSYFKLIIKGNMRKYTPLLNIYIYIGPTNFANKIKD